MFKNLLYAILLGAGMAACLADGNKEETDAGTATEAEPTAGEAPDPAAFKIANEGAGPVRIGMSVDELRTQLPKSYILTDTLLQQEGQAYTAYRLRTAGNSTGLLIEQQCEPECLVWRIRVNSPDYKTTAGLGVGSTFGEVQQQYTITYLASAEAGLVAVAEAAGLSFVLDAGNLPKEQQANPKPEAIAADTRVKQIFVY